MDSTSGHAGKTILRTFLIADVRGYTRFTATRGDAIAARLAKKFADLARDAVEARGGRVIELRGDEALAVFEDTAQAVRAALDFQLTCTEETALDPVLPLPVGIGIDAGEAVPVEDGFRGVALNMAARLCSNAKAGQVIVTRNIATLVAGEDGFAFESRGMVELKGFEQPQELVEAVPPGLSPRPPIAGRLERTLPIELDNAFPLVGREHELHWLRGTWRQCRRRAGRLLFVVGAAQMGKTRLVAEIAAEIAAGGESVEYVGAGGAGTALAVAAIGRAVSSDDPTLVVVNDIEALGDDFSRALSDAVPHIQRSPVMVVVLVRDPATSPILAQTLAMTNGREDGAITLHPLEPEAVFEIVKQYAGDDVADAPIESITRSSGGVPGMIHEIASEWARDEAGRRLAAAAEFISAGRSRREAGLDFANNVIHLRLGRMYTGDAASAVDVNECPYKGLAAFFEQDASQFFGRERLVGELAARTVGAGVLGVIGASGGGKSSVVRAGLVPSLRSNLLPGSSQWIPIVMRPGDHPSASLREAIEREMGPRASELPSALEALDPDQRLVLVVDQFEEIFAILDDEDERASFIAQISYAIDKPDRAIVVLVMRDDFYGRCAPYEHLARALTANHVLVAPMDRDELRRAIELPARRARLHVEAALISALIEEAAGEPGSLPLLSTAMTELWAARTDGWMRMESYLASGGLRGAIARLAEQTFGRLTDPEREAARSMLLRLTGSGEGETVTRRQASLEEFDLADNPAMKAVLDRLTQDRLLTVSEGSVEVAHEALLREWPRLREWLSEDVQSRQLRRHITDSAKQWDASGREPSELYRGARLTSALDWATLHGRDLNELEQQFISAGRQESQREVEKQRLTNRRLRGLLGGVAVFLVLALIAGSLALVQRANASKNATLETAQRLGAQALVQNDLDLSLLLAREGVNISDTTATRGYLLAALLRSPSALGVLRPLPGRELAVYVIDEGKRLLVLNNGNEAGVVDLASRKLVVHLSNVNAIQPAADGKNIVMVDMTFHFSILDTDLRPIRRAPAATPPQAGQPAGDNPANSAIGPDGSSVAFVAPSGNGRFGVEIARLDSKSTSIYQPQPGPIGLISFDPRGRFLITAVTQPRDDEVFEVWRVGDTRRPIQTIHFKDHGTGIPALSPDQRLLAIGGVDGSVGTYKMSNGQGELLHGRHNAAADWVEFSPDSRTLVSTGDDNQVLVWDVASGMLKETLKGHNGRVIRAAFSPNGSTLYTASLDGSIMIWDLSEMDRLGNRFEISRGGSDFIQTMVALSPDRKTLAFPAADNTVVLRDATTLRQLGRIPVGGLPIAIAFSPDSRMLAVDAHTHRGDINGPCLGYRAGVWDIGGGAEVTALNGPSVPKDPNDPGLCADFESFSWAPDGSTLVGGFDDTPGSRGTVWFWSMPSGRQSRPHIEVPIDPNVRRLAVFGVAYSPNGARIAVAWGENTSVYAAAGSAPLYSVNVDDAYGRSKAIAFSTDGSLFATGGGTGLVRFWTTASGRPAGRSVLANACWIDSLEFKPDGHELLASGCDGSARLIDTETRNTIGAPFQGPGDIHNSAVFSGDYASIDVAYTDGSMLRWDIAPVDWRARACEVAGRNLTRDEWARFLPERPYGTVCPGI